MSIGEVLQFGSLIVIVMIIAYVARRSQTVGMPPGLKNAHAEESLRQDETAHSVPHSADGRGQTEKPPQ